MKKKSGFTILELVVVMLVAVLLVVVFFIQKFNVDAMQRDEDSKRAINAMYYALEEGFYAEKGYYPEKISEENLKVMDPQLFTDPYGFVIGTVDSTYSYEAANCEDGKCKEYTLRARLEKEDDYIKRNRVTN
ncbi:MAG: prepilin-type N-terminal cleavage/methylation domain-containing protein [Candidatus Saccharibacteria bacterium]|nr:prepilin-type N-terminal cleavage/methylation domain-containing protein [Candidatus Saccharibacteria bacterium]